jgi:hypothetical protein
VLKAIDEAESLIIALVDAAMLQRMEERYRRVFNKELKSLSVKPKISNR